MFTTWTILLVFSSILTIISFRNINILLSLGAMIGWLSLMAFNLENPLVGVIQGSVIHQWLTLGFIAIGIAVMLIFFKNRGRMVGISDGRTIGGGRASGGGEGEVSAPSPSYEHIGLMEMSPTQYRAIARRAVRRRRR